MRHTAPDSTRMWALAIAGVLLLIAVEFVIALVTVAAGG